MDLQDQLLFPLLVLLGFFFLWGEGKQENLKKNRQSDKHVHNWMVGAF